MQANHIYYFFRHGQTDWNLENRFQGHTDIPLNAHGFKQARELPPILENLGMNHIVSSDLLRAKETACVVAEALGLTLQLDPRLREAHLGQAQGLTSSEIRIRFGQELLLQWRSHSREARSVRYPEGESGYEVLARVSDAIRALSPLPNGSKIGVCTHGGVIRRLLQATHPEPHLHHPIPNTVVYAFRSDMSSSLGLKFEARVR